MRILLLSHSPNDPDGGASRIYHVLSAGLRARGHDVEVRHQEDYGLPAGRLPRLLVERVALPQWISRSARSALPEEHDVVMASGGTTYPLFRRLRTAGGRRPLLVSHAHGMSVYDRIANLGEARLGHFPASAAYRAASAPFSDWWEYRGVAAADVTVVQNLRDLDQLRSRGTVVHVPAAVHPELLAGSAVITPLDQRVPGQVLWFGTWESRKGAWYVPRAFRRLREAVPAARLVIGGTGRSHADLAAHFDPPDRDAITVLPRVSRAEQMQLMNQSQVFLFPSLSEGFGLALPEAMSFGLAAVTSPVGFAADHLTDGVDARVVPATAEHLGAALVQLVTDDDVRVRIGTRGRETARAFTPDRMVDGYDRLFREHAGSRVTV
ncbi:glycosyltransferase family 4 protein [Modestobacter muralis]|uniref:Glycosyltransferase family 4 protein n=1 Tax=Modestobacter muralis TaxID=1608614 RepID=A0A6P0ES78_9ACTN|nr:glycosyltransferase family 4 protein [Modestobacter muralis]NEK94492.1 glycosyltransferase family 4 protein [Modestobacter muralis]NEN51380.1 glycosyltransferase family 4 protein [Modestobacter muralis]